MVKITLTPLVNLQNENTAVTAINNNSDAIEAAMENTLSRDGTAPNEMEANLDMNSFQIINLPSPATVNSPLRLQDLEDFIGGGTITSIPVGGTTGQVLGKNSNVDFDIGWKSSVTSVGLALPADFTITNSPVTSTGTLTGSWATTPTGTGAVVRATSPTLVTPALGTPTALVLTNATGLPVGGITGLGTGVGTFLATPSSANLLAAVTDETGTGVVVFSTSPTLVTPTIGVATATSVNKVAITAPATSATITIPDGVTLTGPAASGTAMTLGNAEAVTGAKTFGAAGNVGKLIIAGTTSGTTVLNATAVASGTLTLPAATDTLVGKATTDILTNKTFDTGGTGNSFSIAGTAVTATTGTGSTLARSAGPTFTGTLTTTILKAGIGAGSPASQVMCNSPSGTAASFQLLQDGVASWLISNPISATTIVFSESGGTKLTINSTGNGSVVSNGPITSSGATATPAGGSAAAVLLLGTTAGFGIYYGSGAPTVSAAAGSLYIRTDNAGANLRLYSNTTGSTTWAAVTSA